jgi:hypothetical protein
MKRLLSLPAESRFNSPFLGAGGTGIEPATCGFGGRGTLAQFVSCRLILPIFLRSLFIVGSSSLAASLGFAVKFAVNCTQNPREVVRPFEVCERDIA